MAHIIYIVTDWTAADWHLRGQLAYMRARGHEVTLLTNGPAEAIERIARREGVDAIPLPMRREIDPLADLTSLARLTSILTRLRPDVVHASTPKAGLLGMIAARAVGVPTKIYLLRGLRLETTSGAKRAILWGCERISMACADHVLCVSESLRVRAAELGLISQSEGLVLGNGSSNGLESARFSPSGELLERAASLRRELHIPDGALVLGFVGRMTKDKGIDELLTSFQTLALEHPNLYLLLVGDFEPGDPVSSNARAVCREHPRIVHTGFVREPEPYYHLMDVLAFPSWREGLPNVPLQAAASGVPVVTFDATGSRDAVLDGQTGSIVPLGDVGALTRGLASYLGDEALRAEHGTRGMSWVAEVFAPELVWGAVATLYD